MCSVEEDIEDLSSFSGRQRGEVPRKNLGKCKKCDENSILLLQKKDPFCRKCFFEYCDHKFRSTIGKTKKIKHGEKVLIACSGGRKSAALLHMTQQALQSASVKQISFVPGIVFIDDTIVTPAVAADEKPKVHEILDDLKSVGYPLLISSLEMVYRLNAGEEFYWSSDSLGSCKDFPFCTEAQSQLKNCMSEMSLSAKLDFVKHIRLLLISEIASYAGYNYVFVGDTASTLAGNLLSNIALGRGSQISPDTNFLDSRYKVPICRPIREFLNKEIALYNHLHNCSYRVLPDLLTKTDNKASVQRLTESFISGLQEDFPATIFTIFRTGGKLSKNAFSVENETCILCRSKLDNLHPEECSALEALKISERLSQISENSSAMSAGSELHTTCNDDIHTMKCEDDMSIFQHLCHGCSIPFRHIKNQVNFFPLLLKRDSVRMERKQMKDAIKDFLIEDNKQS